MPAVTQVILYDDQAWPEHVPAEEVVRVTLHWQAVDGDGRSQESSELYLTTAGRQQLQGELKHWHQIGHAPSGKPAAVRSLLQSRKAYRDKQRAFVDLFGLRCRKDPAYPAYMTATGKNGYWPSWLDQEFEAWLAAGSPAPQKQAS